MAVSRGLFTITPVHDGPTAGAVLAPDGKSVRVTVSAPAVLHAKCVHGDWDLRYNEEIDAADLFAHFDNHSSAHPEDGWAEPKTE